MEKFPIVIDTDPGVDDTIALIMCLAYEGFDVKALTTVGGNVSLEHTSNNARNIVRLTGKHVPVALGEEKPLKRELVTASHIHGINGMGTIQLEPSTQAFMDESAIEVIYKTALDNAGELRLLTLGPLTNIAKALMTYPDLENHLHSIVSMGGAMGVGNVTPAAEYNIYADPDAAKIVYDSKVPVTMVGLDVTIPTVITPEQNAYIRSIDNPIAQVVAALNDYAFSKESPYNPRGAIMHDPLAACYLMNPKVLETKLFNVDVECESTLTRGATLVDRYHLMHQEPNVRVALSANNELFFDTLTTLLRSYS